MFEQAGTPRHHMCLPVNGSLTVVDRRSGTQVPTYYQSPFQLGFGSLTCRQMQSLYSGPQVKNLRSGLIGAAPVTVNTLGRSRMLLSMWCRPRFESLARQRSAPCRW